MSEYPASPAPKFPCEIISNWKTIVSAFDSGIEQRRQKQTYAKFDVSLEYDVLESSEFQTLFNFYNARKGAFEAFYFFTLETADWDGLFIGTGDGSSVTFDLPGKSTSSVAIYNNGAVVAPADYTLLTGGGTENADRITFDTAPALNAILTCDLTGYMRIRCRFEEDKMTKQRFAVALYRTGIKLKGLSA